LERHLGAAATLRAEHPDAVNGILDGENKLADIHGLQHGVQLFLEHAKRGALALDMLP
jgi:hypothetical protein